MLYLPFNVYLDSERASILIEAVLPMLYLPFHVYLGLKSVHILIEAVLPTCRIKLNELFEGMTWVKHGVKGQVAPTTELCVPLHLPLHTHHVNKE